MSASKRVVKELEGLQNNLPPYLRNLTCKDSNVLLWEVLLLPERAPYNLKAFRLNISFPGDYPLRPPKVTFSKTIYHPAIDSNGDVCLPMISKENWEPQTRISQVLEALYTLVNRPEAGQPLRLQLAEQLKENPDLFDQEAREFTLKFGEDRPSEF